MKLLFVAATVLTAACASAPPEAAPVAPIAQQAAKTAQPAATVYEGTYTLQGSRLIDLRVWRDENGDLHGELVGMGRETKFRPTDTPNKFLHETNDDVWFLFTVENGRATALTMHQGSREISGPRTK